MAERLPVFNLAIWSFTFGFFKKRIMIKIPWANGFLITHARKKKRETYLLENVFNCSFLKGRNFLRGRRKKFSKSINNLEPRGSTSLLPFGFFFCGPKGPRGRHVCQREIRFVESTRVTKGGRNKIPEFCFFFRPRKKKKNRKITRGGEREKGVGMFNSRTHHQTCLFTVTM